MPLVTIIEKKKEGKTPRRQELPFGVAEKALQKTNHKDKGWTLPSDSDYQFKAGVLSLKKSKEAKKETPKKETPKKEDKSESSDAGSSEE
jgi:hypothetical protein